MDVPFEIIYYIIACSITVIIILGIVLSIGYMRKHMDELVFKTGSPFYMTSIMIGCIISFGEIFIMYGNPTEETCTAAYWARHLGFAVAFGGVFAKTYRLV